MESPRYYLAMRVRVFVTVGSFALLLLLAYCSLFTVSGQNLDNLGMEALVQRAARVPQQVSFLTHLVSVPALVVVAAFVLAVAVIRRRVALGVRALLIVLLGNATVQLIKALLWRSELGVSWSLDNSFPSGHTAFAASISAALVVIAPRMFRSYAAVFGTVWTGCMSAIVIAQGWHRPADTIGAILAVSAWALLLAPIETGRPNRRWRVGTAIAVILTFMGVVAFGLAWWSVGTEVAQPMSFFQISEAVSSSRGTGRLFGAAAVLLPLGLQAITMAILDRFSIRIQGRTSQETTRM